MTANPPTGVSGGRYTLPAELGGGEVEIDVVTVPGDRVRVTLQVRGEPVVIGLAPSLLTPVKPPLDPEPPIGACVLDREGDVWQHMADPIDGWCGTQPDMATDWAELNSDVYGPLRTLVADPFAEPVQLPWRGLAKGVVSPDLLNVRPVGDGVTLAIERLGDEEGNERWIWLDAETGRTVARAVWAAANQADKGDHE